MRLYATVVVLFLVACSGNQDPPAAETKPASAAHEEEPDTALTERQVDQKLDEIEREITSGQAEPRTLAER